MHVVIYISGAFLEIEAGGCSRAEEGGQGQKVTNESSRELMFCAVNLQA